MAGFLYLGMTSTGMPRPSSVTVTVRPSFSRVTSMRRSEEHTSELQSHRDLHSFPTRRSSDLDGRLLVLGHDVDGDAPPVVGHRHRAAILFEGHLDAGGEPVDHLVDRVVEDLPEQVVVAGRIGAADVHGGPLADGLQPLQHLDVLRGVAGLPRRHHFSSFASGSGTNAICRCATLTLSFLTISRPLPPRAASS